MSALYELDLDFTVADRWYLKPPLDPGGDPFDVRRLFSGEPLEVAGEVFFPLSRPGVPLDVTLTDWDFLATERIGSLIARLAPDDVQRILARVESSDERYEFLNVLARIDCVDRERTLAQVYVGDPPRLQKGTVASLEPLLGPEKKLIGNVARWDIKLDGAGLEGRRIFRVKRWDQWPVVTEEMKVALEEEGATGLAFRLVS